MGVCICCISAFILYLNWGHCATGPWGDVCHIKPSSVTVVLSNSYTSLLKVVDFIIATIVNKKAVCLLRLYQHLSPALHSNGTHWPFLSLCPGLQWRQKSAEEQRRQSAAQGSHRLLEEWNNPSGHTSRHWVWKRYLATSNLSKWRKTREFNMYRKCCEGQNRDADVFETASYTWTQTQKQSLTHHIDIEWFHKI